MNIGAAVAPDAALASIISTIWLSQVIRALVQVSHWQSLWRCGPGTDHHRSYYHRCFPARADKAADNGNLTAISWIHVSSCSCKQCVWLFRPSSLRCLLDQRSPEHAECDSGSGDQWSEIAGGMIVVVGYAMVINMMRAAT